MPAQYGLLLLRESALPRFNYQLRTTPPAIIRKAVERFDDLMINKAAFLSRFPPPGQHPRSYYALTSRYQDDGMAFTPRTRESPTAFFSSVAASSRDLVHGRCEAAKRMHGGDMGAWLKGTDFEFHINDTYDVLRKAGIDPGEEAPCDAGPRIFSAIKRSILDPL
jgi:hypothetical protein